MSHPHLIQLLDFGRQQDRLFVVKTLAAGGSLANYLRDGSMSVELVMSIVEQIASALDYIHAQGLFHGDLRPQNILFDTNRNAFVSDLGVARLFVGLEAITGQGAFMGIPIYIAPEQWTGTAQGTHTDIYVFGIVVFEMLTGTPPFTGDSPFQLMQLHAMAAPPSVQKYRPDIPAALDTVFVTALAKDPRSRFKKASDMASALKLALIGKPGN